MTDQQISEAQAQLVKDLRVKMGYPPRADYAHCGFCGKLVNQAALCCDRCGWKVAS